MIGAVPFRSVCFALTLATTLQASHLLLVFSCTVLKHQNNLRRDQKNSRFPGNHCRELVRAGEFFLFFFENLMLDCMHKFRARSHKISTPCKISTPSSRYGFSHDLHVFFFDVHVENTGMTLAFRLAWSVLCCGHENRV